MEWEGILAGGIFLLCGVCCMACCSPKTSGKHFTSFLVKVGIPKVRGSTYIYVRPDLN